MDEALPDKKPILCLDFDGVLHRYTSGWQGIDVIPDGPVPGATGFLASAVHCFTVCIYSSRSRNEHGIRAMSEAIRSWLHADEELGPEEGDKVFWRLKFPVCKPSAYVSLDDRALTFTGTFPAVGTLLAFRPWNAKDE